MLSLSLVVEWLLQCCTILSGHFKADIHRWLIESPPSASLDTRGKCSKHPGTTATADMGDVTQYIMYET